MMPPKVLKTSSVAEPRAARARRRCAALVWRTRLRSAPRLAMGRQQSLAVASTCSLCRA